MLQDVQQNGTNVLQWYLLGEVGMPKEQDGKYILLGNVGMFSQHCGFSPKHDTKKMQDVNDNYWETWYV